MELLVFSPASAQRPETWLQHVTVNVPYALVSRVHAPTSPAVTVKLHRSCCRGNQRRSRHLSARARVSVYSSGALTRAFVCFTHGGVCSEGGQQWEEAFRGSSLSGSAERREAREAHGPRRSASAIPRGCRSRPACFLPPAPLRLSSRRGHRCQRPGVDFLTSVHLSIQPSILIVPLFLASVSLFGDQRLEAECS